MNIRSILVYTATILALMFPAALLNASRAQDEETFKANKTKACLLFGALIFIIMLFLNT